MGVYYKVVNTAKHQYLDPADFGEPIKWRALLKGGFCLEALKLLISDSHSDASGEDQPWALAGTWAGDPVVLSGDGSTLPEDTSGSLHTVASESFSNIGGLAIAMLSEWGHAESIVAGAEENDTLFLSVADLLMQSEPPHLKRAFNEAFRHGWKARYERVLATRPSHTPLSI